MSNMSDYRNEVYQAASDACREMLDGKTGITQRRIRVKMDSYNFVVTLTVEWADDFDGSMASIRTTP